MLMQLRNRRFLIIILLCPLLFTCCKKKQVNPKVTIQQLMDAAIEKRIKKYENTRRKKCNDKILTRAATLADSIIIARAKALRVLSDTVTRPTAPTRPDLPDLLNPIDSSSPVPLLEEGALEAIDSMPVTQDSVIIKQ